MAITTNSLLDAFILFGIFIYTLYKYFTWDFDYWSKRNVNFIKPLPFVGNFGSVVTVKKSIGICLYDAYFKMANMDYFGIWVFGTPHLVVRSPEIIKNILVRDFNHFYDRTIASDKNADPIMAHVIFIAKNPMWKGVRTKLTPVFTTGKMKGMVPYIVEAGQTMHQHLAKVTSKTTNPTFSLCVNGVVEVKELTARFTTDVITSCVFGVQARSFENEDAEFRAVGRRMFTYNLRNAARGIAYFFAPTAVSALKLTFFEPGVNEFCRQAFWETIEERKRTGAKRNDLIDIIIEMEKSGEFEGDEAVAQAMQFFAAGFETTASTISYVLYECALNEKVQTRLRTEIRKVMDNGKQLDYEAVKGMQYLDMVVKETLRKYPILPFLDRRCVETYNVPNTKLRIEKGTPVYISIHALQNDPQYFPNPHIFDPERFSDENIGKIVPYSYLPFGTGPRNCIGDRFGLMTSKIGIVHIIANYILQCNEKTQRPIIFDPKNFLLHPCGGLYLTFVPVGEKMSVDK